MMKNKHFEKNYHMVSLTHGLCHKPPENVRDTFFLSWNIYGTLTRNSRLMIMPNFLGFETRITILYSLNIFRGKSEAQKK